MSSLSDTTDVHEARRGVGMNIVPVHQPHSLWTYYKFMGRVDLHDQLHMNYYVGRDGKKWWRYLFWFMLHCAVVNSYIQRCVNQTNKEEGILSHRLSP